MDLNAKVAYLEYLVEKQSREIFDIKSVMLQLIGGLFHPQKQSDIINLHICVLNGDNFPHPSSLEKIDVCPTTRQGDELEERMKRVEELLSKRASPAIENEKENENDYLWNLASKYLSTQTFSHPDDPVYKNEGAIRAPIAIPEPSWHLLTCTFGPVLSTSNNHRVFNSFDLCGNE
jgi:hypothetical protein